jgi:ribonuclease P protein component
VAFAIGRAFGPAVTRNRLRRRLRAICRTLTVSGDLPPGLLLIGATPAANELTYDQLKMELGDMVRQATLAPVRLTDGSKA